jgi:serine protease
MPINVTYDHSLPASAAPPRDGPLQRLRRFPANAIAAALAAGALLLGAAALKYVTSANTSTAVAVAQTPYDPHELIVGYRGAASALIAEITRGAHLSATVSTHPELTPGEKLLTLAPGVNPAQAASEVEHLPGVRYALPDYQAHIAGTFIPDDVGRSGKIHGWESVQWNFLGRAGVNAPHAWFNLLADHRPGARGVVIAVVDTGIAFRNWRTFKRSPDFNGTRFADPCDLVLGAIRNGNCTDPYALDRESHGTFVAGTIAEATNNNYGLTGLAYQATILPVRVLDSQGNGDSSTIAAGIRYAVAHGAQVINLSIEFSPGTTAGQIPDVASAITYAHNHGVVVVGAAGNDENNRLDYPAALPDVISVGATTKDRCLAIYSDVGRGLDLVAPGGGDDAASVPGSKCHALRNLPDIYQMTFSNPEHPSGFGLPGGWFGTSMAAPAVSAAAAMVIASGVLGTNHPTPTAILDRLEATAQPLGAAQPNNAYGYGLVDIGAATSNGGPLVPPTKPYTLPGATTAGVVR